MDLRRIQFVTAQLGRKPGKHLALAHLLDAGDLPDDTWRVIDERTWRTGEIGPAAPWAERARLAGSVTAWRSFRSKTAAKWTWIQVAQLASAEDAETALTSIGGRRLANLRARVRLVSETAVPMEPFAGASAVWALEQRTDGPGGPGVSLMLAAAIGDWLTAMGLAGSPEWDWHSAVRLATLQAERLSA